MATNEEILTPRVLVVPTQSPCPANAPKGSLNISGSKLFVAVSATAWELVTSS